MPKQRRRTPKDWLALSSVVIAGAGVLWTVIAHFIPSAERPPKPDSKPVATTSINAIASGPGSVAYMSGGSVNISMPAPQSPPARSNSSTKASPP